MPELRRPGFLTLEYLAGRRARYVPPFRLFLFISVTMFLVLGVAGASFVRSAEVSGPTAGAESEVAQAARRLGEADLAELNRAMTSRLPQVMFLVAPVFGSLVWLLHRKREPYLVPHLIFSLHVHAFAFIALTVGTLLGLPFGREPKAAPAVAMLWLATYVYLAQRRVYGRGRWITLLHTLLLGMLQSIVLVVVLFGVLMVLIAARA